MHHCIYAWIIFYFFVSFHHLLIRLHAPMLPLSDRPHPAFPLWILAGVLLVMALMSALGMWFDERTVLAHPQAANVWAKPLKFQLSMAIQLVTVAWSLHVLRMNGRSLRGEKALVWLLVITVIFEASYIALQGARGVPSHFNRSTPWESIAASLMAVGAYILVGTSAWTRQDKHQRAPMLLAIGLGFASMFVLAGWTGSALGQFRGPFVQQPPFGGITVPLAGWRLDVGDLRISHFFGVHAMQAIPLMAWLLRRQSLAVSHACIAVFACIWATITLAFMAMAKANMGFF
jgi:hypothetical protein